MAAWSRSGMPRNTLTFLTFPWGLMHGAQEASIEVSCHFALDDLACLVQGMAAGGIHIDPLITHRPAIIDAPDTYAMLRDNPGEMLGVVFDWRD